MTGQSEIDWKSVVERIRSGDPGGEEVLYDNLASGARLFLKRRLRTDDVDDRVHDVFLIVVEAIRRGELRESERLMSFVRTVLYRQLNRGISQIIRARATSATLDSAGHLSDTGPSPEQQVLSEEKVDLMRQLIREMSRRDFEVLMRSYVRGQSPEQIRREMDLNATQLYLLKSRAKGKLSLLVKERLGGNL